MTNARTAGSTVILVALILTCSYTIQAQEPQHWRIGTPITTFWYWDIPGPPHLTDPLVIKQIAEAGFNLVPCLTEEELDVASRHGLRVMLVEEAVIQPEALEDPARLAKLDALIARVKNNPSLYAYFVADEPSPARFPALGRLVAHLRAQDPAHLAYINLLPHAASARDEDLPTEYAEYKEYERPFMETVKPELLSYDFYNFSVDNDWDWYFNQLGLTRRAALDAGIPFLNIVQACKWDKTWRAPNGDELRWLNYTTLAYGAQGLCYFMYCNPGLYKEFKEQAGTMLRPDGTTTPLYEAAKALNPQFVAIASQLQPLRSLGAYHVGTIYPGTRALPADAPFHLDPTAKGDSPTPATSGKRYMYYTNSGILHERYTNSGILLGYFGKPDNSGKPCEPTHVLVVNLDYRNAVTTTVVGPDPLEAFDAAQQTWKRVSSPKITLTLPPGGGTLVRVGE
jgi:hypothetical protein